MVNSSNIEKEIRQDFQNWKASYTNLVNEIIIIKAKLIASGIDDSFLKSIIYTWFNEIGEVNMYLHSCRYSNKILSFLYELLYCGEENMWYIDVMIRVKEFVSQMLSIIVCYI